MTVPGSPPVKGSAAALDAAEKLQEAAREAMLYDASGEDVISLSITHIRPHKTTGSAEIIGAIIDALTGIAYLDPLQVTEVFYVEEQGEFEEYHVTVNSP